MRRAVLSLLAAGLLLSAAAGMAEKARERLTLVTDRLVAVGEEMVGEPISGTVFLEDTVQIGVSLDTTYSYHMHIWTNSTFNILEFWMETPSGEIAELAEGDHTTLSIYPTVSGEYNLNMVLHMGDYADSAGYAAALFHSPRVQVSRPSSEDS